MDNRQANHPLQSLEWGEFREKTGVKVIREKNLQITIHKVPKTSFNIGYFPKGPMPDKQMVEDLKRIGKRERCIFIQIEPEVRKSNQVIEKIQKLGLKPSVRPLFTRFTFKLDLTPTEEELLKNMHQKTRYNIRIAEKHGIKVVEDNSDKAFKQYLKLTKETTDRQKFYAHSENYHKLMWKTLGKNREDKNKLSAHLFLAKYKSETLATWIVFVFKDKLYYPYGASTTRHKEKMASNLMMWEVIKFGKKHGLKEFDMWGALGQNPDKKDPWFGFHRFKQGYGGELVEFVGNFDLVINPYLYTLYPLANKLRWFYLRLRKS